MTWWSGCRRCCSTIARFVSCMAGHNWRQQCVAIATGLFAVYALQETYVALYKVGTSMQETCTEKPCLFMNVYPGNPGMNEKRTAPDYMSVQNGFSGPRKVESAWTEGLAISDGKKTIWWMKKSFWNNLYSFNFHIMYLMTAVLNLLTGFFRYPLFPDSWFPDPVSRRPACPEICKSHEGDIPNFKLSLTAYGTFCLFAWPIMSAFHDVFLLRGHGPRVTITLAWLCVVCQGNAAVASFVLVQCGLQVRYLRFFVLEPDVCTCYFHMSSFASLLALGTPIGLMYRYYCKLRLVYSSVFCGDVLYFKQFSVPFSIVQNSMSWARSSILMPRSPSDCPPLAEQWKMDRGLCLISIRVSFYASYLTLGLLYWFPVSLSISLSMVLPKLGDVLVTWLLWDQGASGMELIIVNINMKNFFVKCLLCLPAVLMLYIMYCSIVKCRTCQKCVKFIHLTVACMCMPLCMLLLPPAKLYIDGKISEEDLHIFLAGWSVSAWGCFLVASFHLFQSRSYFGMTYSFWKALKIYEALLDCKGTLPGDTFALSNFLSLSEQFDPETAALFKLDQLFEVARQTAQSSEQLADDADASWARELGLLVDALHSRGDVELVPVSHQDSHQSSSSVQ